MNREVFLNLIKKYNLPKLITDPIGKKIIEVKESEWDNNIIYFIFDNNECLGIKGSNRYEDVELEIIDEDNADKEDYLVTFNINAKKEYDKINNDLWQKQKLEQEKIEYKRLKVKFEG